MTATTVKARPEQQEDVSEFAGLERMLTTLQAKRKHFAQRGIGEGLRVCALAELVVIRSLNTYDNDKYPF